MSVLVKGMKMPETCIQCPMQFGGWCYVAPSEIDERVAPTVDEAWKQKKPRWCPLQETDDISFYGMTLEAERRVMRNAIRLIREIVDDFVFGCDSGSDDWRDFFTGYSDELDEMVRNADYPSDFCYALPSDEWLFKNLISWGTTRGGMGSACEECAKIGKILKEEG